MSAARRAVAGTLLLVVVVAVVGVGAVLDGVGALDARLLVAGVLLGAVSTLACAVRWRLVARELGVPLDLGTAVAACYRAQLLNTVLPAGVLGDVDRGLGHARAVGRTAPALRSVAWERLCGQVVQGVLAVAVLAVVPSPLRRLLPAAAVVALGLLLVVLLVAARPGAADRGGRVRRARSAVRQELRVALVLRPVWPGVAATSGAALACHVATYVVAARAAGVEAPVSVLVPLALVVLVAAGLPVNVAGWGPREGVAAWASAVVGLGAAAGLATSVAFGAAVLVANLPGALVLLAGRRGALREVRDPVPARAGGGGGG